MVRSKSGTSRAQIFLFYELMEAEIVALCCAHLLPPEETPTAIKAAGVTSHLIIFLVILSTNDELPNLLTCFSSIFSEKRPRFFSSMWFFRFRLYAVREIDVTVFWNTEEFIRLALLTPHKPVCVPLSDTVCLFTGPLLSHFSRQLSFQWRPSTTLLFAYKLPLKFPSIRVQS